ncbi:MAG: copper resistance protein, partial [Mycobacterium sp.]|nr:copper resistance protein [Mycobacterium sp.]
MRVATALVAVVTAVAATTAIAFALALHAVEPVAAVARILADTAAVGTIGLAIVPALDDGRRRTEITRLSQVPLLVVGAVWLVGELLRLVIAAGEAAATPLAQLSVHAVGEFVLHTVAGRTGLLSVGAATAVCGLAAARNRSASSRVTVAGAAGVGFAARAVSGHLSESTWGAIAIAMHALAAAVWCGGLAALAVTVRHKGQWARVLPRFSQVSLACVVVVSTSGVLGALLESGSPVTWSASAHGRLLLAKVAVLLALVAL